MKQKKAIRFFVALSCQAIIFLAIMAFIPKASTKNEGQETNHSSKKLKVLVTGHKGYIGSRFVAAVKDKYDIVGYDLVDGDDILDYEKLKKRMKGVDVVVHEAAIPKPVPGKTFEDYFTTNVQGTLNVVKAAQESGVKRVVYASSTTVYGIEGGIPFSYPIKEKQPFVSQYLKADDLQMRDIDLSYHISKVMAEQELAWYGLNKKIQVIALRYGPTDHVNIGAHVSIENVIQATDLAITNPNEFWYEAFSIVDEDVDFIDITKAKTLLGYKPKPAKYTKKQTVATFDKRLELEKTN
ncbi:NAD(P)-dependent oxidoreductase [Flavobacterium rakeshii]|uniref:NAD-dependent epimerase/dehydratase family protein n=1 Tax=Flavobacterium rakeshii TaxID=1038845 RepID=UPI002E7B52EA|nr:NAD(P)-dependent oxidoreductase [Flavobacterium rakeshii]MEE1900066.1 NAD(P)-dependent oxidoreductase [Flavobacterium rakeshii]